MSNQNRTYEVNADGVSFNLPLFIVSPEGDSLTRTEEIIRLPYCKEAWVKKKTCFLSKTDTGWSELNGNPIQIYSDDVSKLEVVTIDGNKYPKGAPTVDSFLLADNNIDKGADNLTEYCYAYVERTQVPASAGVLHEAIIATLIIDLSVRVKEIPGGSSELTQVLLKLEEARMWLNKI